MDSLSVGALAPAARLAGTVLIVIAVPVLLVSFSVRSVAFSDSFYREEFARYRVGAVTGLDDRELARVADAFIGYFQSGPGRLDMQVDLPGGERPLFSEREIRHMEDVQALMERVLQAGGVSLIALLLGATAVVSAGPGTALPALLRAGALAGAVSAGLVGLLALGSVLDFGRLFVQFHHLTFSNDLWLLDPQRDRLIQLFPQGFFFDAAILIGLRAAGFGAVIGTASWLALRLVR